MNLKSSEAQELIERYALKAAEPFREDWKKLKPEYVFDTKNIGELLRKAGAGGEGDEE